MWHGAQINALGMGGSNKLDLFIVLQCMTPWAEDLEVLCPYRGGGH